MKHAGIYYLANSTKYYLAELEVKDDSIKIFNVDSDKLIYKANVHELINEISIQGNSTLIRFPDGSSFIPDDPSLKWEWDSLSSKLIRKITNNLKSLVLIILLTPLFLFFALFYGMPFLSSEIANRVSQDSKEVISTNLLKKLEDEYFEESKIDYLEQEKLKKEFHKNLSDLNINSDNYRLMFYKSDIFGANAVALPDGTIVVTDQMISKLLNSPNLIMAILFHEVGHVEDNHGLSQIIQSLGIGLIITLIIGDAQGLSDALVGSGFVLVQQSFSRKMEVEADIFALESLKKLEMPVEDFSNALESIMDLDEDAYSPYKNYLSSHPHTKKRIELAKEYRQ
jgi:Zn-dependent protease with chaperone function